MSWARLAASWSPSPAATIEPFMRMCHLCASASGSRAPASAAHEVREREPPAEHVEEGEHALRGGGGAGFHLGAEPVLGPALLALLEERQDEHVLGWEVTVKAHLGHA